MSFILLIVLLIAIIIIAILFAYKYKFGGVLRPDALQYFIADTGYNSQLKDNKNMYTINPNYKYNGDHILAVNIEDLNYDTLNSYKTITNNLWILHSMYIYCLEFQVTSSYGKIYKNYPYTIRFTKNGHVYNISYTYEFNNNELTETFGLTIDTEFINVNNFRDIIDNINDKGLKSYIESVTTPNKYMQGSYKLYNPDDIDDKNTSNVVTNPSNDNGESGVESSALVPLTFSKESLDDTKPDNSNSNSILLDENI